jgi:hypothetical protein
MSSNYFFILFSHVWEKIAILGKSLGTNFCYDFYVKSVTFLLLFLLQRLRSLLIGLLFFCLLSQPVSISGEEVSEKKAGNFSGDLRTGEDEAFLRGNWSFSHSRFGGIIALPGAGGEDLKLELLHWWLSSPYFLAGRLGMQGLLSSLRNPLGQGAGSSTFSQRGELRIDGSLSRGNASYGVLLFPALPFSSWILSREDQQLLSIGMDIAVKGFLFRPRLYGSLFETDLGESYLTGISGGEIVWGVDGGGKSLEVQLQFFRSGTISGKGGLFLQGQLSAATEGVEWILLSGWRDSRFRDLRNPVEAPSGEQFLLHPLLRLGQQKEGSLLLSSRFLLEKPNIPLGRYLPFRIEPLFRYETPFRYFIGKVSASAMLDLEADGTWEKRKEASLGFDKLQGRFLGAQLQLDGELSCREEREMTRKELRRSFYLDLAFDGSISFRALSLSSAPAYRWDIIEEKGIPRGGLRIDYQQDDASLSLSLKWDSLKELEKLSLTATLRVQN